MKNVPGGRLRHRLIQFLTKKPYRDHMRAPKIQATRSIPKPVMPQTENSKLAANYYYTRDLRREVKPAVSILDKQITAGETSTAGALAFCAPVPGNKYNPGEAPYPYEMNITQQIGPEGKWN